MSYINQIEKAKTISISGYLTLPNDYNGNRAAVIPDAIVKYCADYYNLSKSNTKTLDPMCGLGTIPRVINLLGGDALGIEINADTYKYAVDLTKNNKILHGDIREFDFPKNSYKCIFTSMPFDWFKTTSDDVCTSYAEKFTHLLDDNGFILLDSVENINRNGESWDVAMRQSNYLEANNFKLQEIIRFNLVNNNQDLLNSLIMKFVRN